MNFSKEGVWNTGILQELECEIQEFRMRL